jgi:hypothetical protein
MKKWLCGLMLGIATTAQAQPVKPQQVIGSAQLLTTLKQISFRINWVQPQAVDSTMVAVFLSNDTIPVLYKKTKNPDTVSFTIPDDTTTYRFLLINIRRGLSSQPANVNFYFNADNYYKLTRLHVKPDSVKMDTTQTNRTVQFCAFLEYNDGSIVMRDKDRTIPQCLTEYDKFPTVLRKTVGARQRNANTVCLNWQAVGGGTIQNETCS